MNQPSVLIVDDDPALLQALPETVRLRMGAVTIDTAESTVAALDRIAVREYDAIVTDIKMAGMDGFALLAEIRSLRPDTPTLMITGHGEPELVINAIRGGAYDFIQKPIDREYFVASLRQALQIAGLRRQDRERQLALVRRASELERTVDDRTRELRDLSRVMESPLRWLTSPNQQMQKVVQQIRQVADSPLSVIVEGETGTGKELVARSIHQLSARCKKPFVAVDCGAIPETLIESEFFGYEKGAFTGAHQRTEGRFQLAEGGSLFLDEIVNLPLPLQAKLLRVLQERVVQPLGNRKPVRLDVRVIAATNLSLAGEAREGRFRRDLYYRLNEFIISLPPLRDREDILDLANGFLVEAGIEFGRPCREVSAEAAAVLLRYPWPGNVRELRNVIRRATLLASDVIEPEHLWFLPVEDSPIAGRQQEIKAGHSSLKEVGEAAAAAAEKQAIRCALEVTKGNKSEAARLLRTDYKTLHVKMKQYCVDAWRFKETGNLATRRGPKASRLSTNSANSCSSD